MVPVLFVWSQPIPRLDIKPVSFLSETVLFVWSQYCSYGPRRFAGESVRVRSTTSDIPGWGLA
jgi:hypothetical protein